MTAGENRFSMVSFGVCWSAVMVIWILVGSLLYEGPQNAIFHISMDDVQFMDECATREPHQRVQPTSKCLKSAYQATK
jgi:hypothetical protein